MKDHKVTKLVWASAILAFLLTVGFALTKYRNYKIETFMAPYNELVDSAAGEKEAVAQLGKPNEVITSKAAFNKWTRDFKPLTNERIHFEYKVLVYWADPWDDGEGYVVYLFIDQHHIVRHAVLGG